MEVYVEYAAAENFCMDFVLLWSAKLAAKNRASAWRISIASVLGASFAVIFPFFGLGGIAAVAVKLAAGGVLCLIAGVFTGVGSYLKFTAAFTALTFALGGGLMAVFSLADVSYGSGGGVIVSSVPVGIPLFCALCLLIFIKKTAAKICGSRSKIAVICRIYAGKSCVKLPAFFDSGNRVYRRGCPVSVIPARYAVKLTDVDGIKNFVNVHTVAGDKKLPVFTADKVEIDYGEKVSTLRGVTFCISGGSGGRAVLHPDLAEETLCSKS